MMAKYTLTLHIIRQSLKKSLCAATQIYCDWSTTPFESVCTESWMAHPTSAVGCLDPEQDTKQIYQHPTAFVRQMSWIQARNGFSCTAAVQISLHRNVLSHVCRETAWLQWDEYGHKVMMTSKERFKAQKHSSKFSCSGALVLTS